MMGVEELPQSEGPHVIDRSISSNCRRIALLAFAALSATAMVQPPAATAHEIESADRASYILFAPGSGSSTMSGSMDDLKRARSLRSGSEAMLYVRQGGAAYVIRDAATLREARAIFQPQEELGARQGELGSRQAALGARQARLGAEQARLGSRQADATPRQAVELGRQQNELGRRQGELGEQQAALGRQQDALGREQSRLGQLANAKLRALLAEALRRGVAQRVR